MSTIKKNSAALMLKKLKEKEIKKNERVCQMGNEVIKELKRNNLVKK